MRFKADTSGNVAIYDETANGDAPLTAPLSNLSHTKWHSSFNYIGVTSIQSGTASLPVVTNGTWRNANVTLFAHGVGGGVVPGVFGVLPNLNGTGIDVPLLGSIIIFQTANDIANPFRMVNLLADTTNVYLLDFGYALGADFPATNLPWRVYVTDKVFSPT